MTDKKLMIWKRVGRITGAWMSGSGTQAGGADVESLGETGPVVRNSVLDMLNCKGSYHFLRIKECIFEFHKYTVDVLQIFQIIQIF